eukprot:COSAG06_NODE_17_length_34906_cov_31.908268_42_plen_74_part_00
MSSLIINLDLDLEHHLNHTTLKLHHGQQRARQLIQLWLWLELRLSSSGSGSGSCGTCSSALHTLVCDRSRSRS